MLFGSKNCLISYYLFYLIHKIIYYNLFYNIKGHITLINKNHKKLYQKQVFGLIYWKNQ